MNLSDGSRQELIRRISSTGAGSVLEIIQFTGGDQLKNWGDANRSRGMPSPSSTALTIARNDIVARFVMMEETTCKDTLRDHKLNKKPSNLNANNMPAIVLHSRSRTSCRMTFMCSLVGNLLCPPCLTLSHLTFFLPSSLTHDLVNSGWNISS